MKKIILLGIFYSCPQFLWIFLRNTKINKRDYRSHKPLLRAVYKEKNLKTNRSHIPVLSMTHQPIKYDVFKLKSSRIIDCINLLHHIVGKNTLSWDISN